MSLFDPLEDKKKKFNIFDYASTIAPKQTPVNQYQTPMNSAPADQYMTPIPKAPVQQFQPYNPVPNYTEGYASKQAQNIFNGPEMKQEMATKFEVPKPYTGNFSLIPPNYTKAQIIAIGNDQKKRKAEEQAKFSKQNDYAKSMVSAIDDMLGAGKPRPMTPEELNINYSGLTEEDKKKIIGMSNDMLRATEMNRSITPVLKMYEDLPYQVKDYMLGKYGETMIQELGLDKARDWVKKNTSGIPIAGQIIGGLVDTYYGLAEGADIAAKGTIGIAGNIGNIVSKSEGQQSGMVEEKNITTNITNAIGGYAQGYRATTMPKLTIALNIAMNTPIVRDVLGGIMSGADNSVGGNLEKLPGLKQFSDSLATEQDKAEFRSLLTQVAFLGLVKARSVKGKISIQDGLPTLEGSKLGKINTLIDIGTYKALQPLNNVMNRWLKIFDTVKPVQGSMSNIFDEFMKQAKKRGYKVPETPTAKDFQDFAKKWKEAGGKNPEGPSYEVPQQTAPTKQPGARTEPKTKVGEVGQKMLEREVANVNRITPNQRKDFVQRHGITPEIYLINNGYLGTPQQNVTELATDFNNLLDQKGQALSMMTTPVKNKRFGTALQDNIEFSQETLGDSTRMQELQDKYMTEGLNGMEMREVVKNFQRTNLFTYMKDITSGSKKVRATNIDKGMRKFMDQYAQEHGFDNLLDVNKDIQAKKALMDYIGGRNIGHGANNPISLGDQVLFGLDPFKAGLMAVITKKILMYPPIRRFYGKILNRMLHGGESFDKVNFDFDKIFKQSTSREFEYEMEKRANGSPQLPSQQTPTPVGSGGPQVNVPNTPQPTIPKQKIIRETYGPNYKEPTKPTDTTKVDLLTKKAETQAKTQANLDKFNKVKETGAELKDSNSWKKGDVSKLGTLDTGIVMDGRNRTVMIEGKKYNDFEVKPVYRDTEVTDFAKEMSTTTKEQPKDTSIDPKDFGMIRQQYLSDGLQLMEVKSLEELPKEFQDRLLEIANQGARGDMVKLADKIDKLMEDWNNYKNPPKKELITKKEEVKTNGGVINDGIKRNFRESGQNAPFEKRTPEAQAKFDAYIAKQQQKPMTVMERNYQNMEKYGTNNPTQTDIDAYNNIQQKPLIKKSEPVETPKETTPTPTYDKIKVVSKVRDNNQTIVIDKGEITVTNRSGKDKIGSYTFPVKERDRLETSFGNPNYNKVKFIEKLYKDAFPGNFTDEIGSSAINSRLIDAQISGINEAYNRIPGKKTNKEYNTPEKKTLITKKTIDDGSKLQTKGGSTVGRSDEIGQISVPKDEISTESTMQGTDNGAEQERLRGYLSNDVSNGDGSGTGLPVSKSQQSAINQEVIKILEDKQFSKKPEDYSKEEIQKLLKYEGGGGLLKKEGDFSGSNDEFYTPKEVVDSMRYLAKKYGYTEGATILEPSVGIGRFLRTKPMRTGNATGYEIDKVSGTIAAVTNPQALIKIGDYQDQFMDFTGTRPLTAAELANKPKYDVVIGNPPYKLRDTKQRRLGDLKEVNRFEDYFMIRGIQSLNNGGVMVVVVPSSFMDKPNYLAKNILRNEGANLIDAYRLPNKTFPNTDVGTDILVFKKGDITTAEAMDFFKNTSDGERFKQNPDKVLGEVGERTNRFGKLENYVKGDNTAVTKIIKDGISETVKRASNLIEQNNLGPLTITNMVTGQQEILETPDVVMPKKEIKYVTPYGETVYPKTEKLTRTKEELSQTKETEKKSLITKKNTVAEPTTTKEITQAKPIKKKPSQPVSGGLFDIPTEKEIKVISDKIVNPVIQPQPEGISNRIFNQDNVNPEHLQDILKYQDMTNVFDEVEGVSYKENPQLLNYMDGSTYLNYNYFAGDIYAKLDQLEMDKSMIDADQYQKQRQGLLAILPKQQVIEDMHFNPLDNELMAMDTGEIYSKGEYVYDNETKRGNMVYKDVAMPIRYKFTERLKQEGVPSKARVYAGEIINYFEGGRVEKERAGIIQEDAIYYFNKFIKEAITAELQEKIVDNHNRRNRSVVPVDVSQIPFVIKDISKNFRGKPLVFKEVQIESALKAAMKGTYISALGVGYGKTMVGILAMMKNMQKGLTKRPLIVVPGQTMVGWIETIKGLFPTYKINNLGTLDTKRRSKLNKELGSDKSKRIDDNTITIITHSAFENQIAFKKATQDKITAEFLDDMKTEDMSMKQMEALNEKNEAIVGSAGTTKTKAGGDFSMYSNEFLSEQFNKVENLSREEFVKSFIESDTTKNPLSKMKAEEMYAMKPMFMEDFGFDSILVDEIHNFKNVFSKAKIEEGDKNMYGNVVGSTSKRGMKMAIATNYILSNNNGRGVLGLTATPFNNQAIEVYNLLNFVGRARLKKLGITNMNDFMTKFSNFTESLVVKPSGTDVAYRMIQKNFVNLQDLQRLISEFIDYKGDSPEIIKPELITKIVKLQFSELQKQIQEEIEMRIDANAELGDVIGGQQEARANVVSPYFTRRAGSLPTPQEILKNSPKLDFFADLIIEKNKLGNKDGAIMFLPMGTDLHEIIREGISLKTGVPINKIGIINGTPKFKSKMVETAEKFNKGEYEILIGGENINEGIDLQHKTYIMYDTLLGWNPTVTTQKNGRGRRQGNLRNYVVSVLPLMENSVDSVMLQKKEEKQSRINDIFSAEGEVFSTEDIDPAEEKLALMTNPIKKAKIAINIEMKKINRSIEVIKGDIAELERHKSNLAQEVDLLPKLYENISRYGSNDSMSDYVKRQKKEIESLEGKIKRSKEKIQKYNINIEADLAVKTMELETLQAEIKTIESTMESRIQKYRLEQEQEAMDRKDKQYYLNQINDITKQLKVFKDVEEQAEFKKSLLSKK